jgi:hypothetical protein
MDETSEATSQEEDRHFRALGQLVSSAAFLDFIAFHFLASRARISLATANVLMGRDNFDATLARLGRLVAASEMSDDAKRVYRERSKGAQKAMLRRNQLVHSAWRVPGRNPDSIDRFVRHRDPVDGIVVEPMAVDEIETLADQISDLTTQLIDMAGDLGIVQE